MCGDYSCPYRNSDGYCKITACVKSVQQCITNANIQNNEMIIFPQTIGDTTFNNKKELFEWVINQQKMNKDPDYGRGNFS